MEGNVSQSLLHLVWKNLTNTKSILITAEDFIFWITKELKNYLLERFSGWDEIPEIHMSRQLQLMISELLSCRDLMTSEFLDCFACSVLWVASEWIISFLFAFFCRNRERRIDINTVNMRLFTFWKKRSDKEAGVRGENGIFGYEIVAKLKKKKK